jgi:hypothetical protein
MTVGPEGFMIGVCRLNLILWPSIDKIAVRKISRSWFLVLFD